MNFINCGDIMQSGYIGLIGLGAIGTPIAHKLYNKYNDRFVLIANDLFKEQLMSQDMYINGQSFRPRIVSDKREIEQLSLLMICIKNYDLKNALDDIACVISEDTVILPLQNGIYSYELFKKSFPNNIVLQGFVQGPNTVINNGEFYYKNPGRMYIGTLDKEYVKIAMEVYDVLRLASVDISYEEKINREVWKKWMLNVAGNSITALTGADYSMFKNSIDLQNLAKKCMNEFLSVAIAEHIGLCNDDINDIINYYITYSGHKKTSMLVDVLNNRKTENEYILGEILKKGKNQCINMPITETLYRLVKIKEMVYSGGKL